MKLRIVYDNESLPGFERGWGFSCLVETPGERVLLDTGWDGPRLVRNLRAFGLKPSDIDRVILSHAHWDHIGGLPNLQRNDLIVYVPKSFSKRLRGELAANYILREISKPRKITKNMWTTGELGKEIKEQALVIKTLEGIFVVVGCSHPGVQTILSAARRFGKVLGILGGLHDFQEYWVLAGLKIVAPSHCTTHKKEIKTRFPKTFVEVKAGSELVVK